MFPPSLLMPPPAPACNRESPLVKGISPYRPAPRMAKSGASILRPPPRDLLVQQPKVLGRGVSIGTPAATQGPSPYFSHSSCCKRLQANIYFGYRPIRSSTVGHGWPKVGTPQVFPSLARARSRDAERNVLHEYTSGACQAQTSHL